MTFLAWWLMVHFAGLVVLGIVAGTIWWFGSKHDRHP